MSSLLLDTCTFLWLASGDSGRISDTILKQINEAPFVYVSSISAWEISLLECRVHCSGSFRLLQLIRNFSSIQ